MKQSLMMTITLKKCSWQFFFQYELNFRKSIDYRLRIFRICFLFWRILNFFATSKDKNILLNSIYKNLYNKVLRFSFDLQCTNNWLLLTNKVKISMEIKATTDSIIPLIWSVPGSTLCNTVIRILQLNKRISSVL